MNNEEEPYFEFTWTITNFSFCRHKPKEFLNSPVFRIPFLKDTGWHLKLYPKSHQDSDILTCFLCRTQAGPEFLWVMFCLTIDDSNCEVRENFKKASISEKFVRLSRNRYLDKVNVTEPDILTIKCKLWQQRQDASSSINQAPHPPVFCSASTSIPVERRSIQWNIESFFSLPSQHEVSIPVVSGSPENPKLLVTLSWSDHNEKSGGDISMEVREMPELSGKSFQLGCRITLTQKKSVEQLAKAWYHFKTVQKNYILWVKTYSDSVWIFPLKGIDRRSLRNDGLQQGALVLDCNFALSYDPVVSCVTSSGYVHPKVEEPQEEEEEEEKDDDSDIAATSGWKEVLLRNFHDQTCVFNYKFLQKNIEYKMGRKKKMFNSVGEEFQIAIHITVKNFLQTEDLKEYQFPSSLSSAERAYVHRYCQSLGLKSKSRGQGVTRFLTVYKKEGSTIVQDDATFEVGDSSQRHAAALLHKFPLTARERQELLPPTERDRILGQDVREVSRNIGRLGSGIPMVPLRRCENEYTAFRQSLPIWNCQEEIIRTINSHQVVIISGETGSGKTTQVPQLILDHASVTGQACRIICTQPRRIAAISVSERVALERDDKIGQSVGYQVRLESRISPKTLLTFCTTGVLLRTLMGGDASVATVTHILVDELHERDRLSDFLLIVLRDLLLKFRNLKLVLMSASLDIQLFCKYFSNCPIIEVPGRSFEVNTFFLEDILKGTGYTNQLMLSYKKDLEKQKSKKKPDFWNSVQKTGANGNCVQEPETKRTDDTQDLGLEELSLNSSEVTTFEENSSAAISMDEIIEEKWVSGDDDFTYIMQLILSENLSVDHQHSETHVSPLMLAAGRGNADVVEQLLVLGASIHIKSTNGWTAVDWAEKFGHKEVAELLASQWTIDNVEKNSPDTVEEHKSLLEEDRILLEAYSHSVDEEKIDHDLVVYLLSRISASQEEGSVLIFLPGYDDIISLRDKILNSTPTIPENRTMLFTLHSQMPSTDQKRVFKSPPPGMRKIILATNIAETSITINDVVFVIDCGKVKEKTFDSITGVTQLKAGWISKASAIQRRGRAGRCRPGLCYHLYSRTRFNSFKKFQVPEILRVPIHELCLQAKLLAPPNAPIADFLAKAPDPPPFMVTRNAVTLLKTIDALDPWEELTELGLHLLDLPIEPRLGKMILYSVVLKCLDPVLTITCCLSYRDPFVIPSQPAQKRAVAMAKRKFAGETFSDHMLLLRAFQAWQRAKSENRERNFCSKNFISSATMEMVVGMRTQILGQLRASGFIRPGGSGDIRDLNCNSEIWAVIKAALCAGSYPNIIRIDRDRQQLITQKESKVKFQHSSILNKLPVSAKQSAASLHRQMMSELPCDWLLYEEMMRTGSQAYAHCCTLITPVTVALFTGAARLPLDALHEPDQARLEGYMEEEDSEDDTKYDSQKAMLKIDDWISFRAEPEISRLVLQVRQKWHALFLRRMHAPSKPLTQADEAVIRAIAGVLISEDQALNLHQPPGIGQRPKPGSTEYSSPMHKKNSAHNSPNHRNSNNLNTNHSYAALGNNWSENPNGMSPHSPGSSSYKSPFPNCSPKRCPIPPPFSSPQLSAKPNTPTSGTEERIRYFIIKANTSRVLEISMANNIWAFVATTERKLLSTVKVSISIQNAISGFAPYSTSLTASVWPKVLLSHEWIRKANLPFQNTRHLQNSWNENRKVQISRDGQELEPTVGEALCQLILKGQPVLIPEGANNGRRPYPGRDNYQNDPNTASRSQIQWDSNQSTSYCNTYVSGQAYWSQSNP
ncbi:hypothetical protein JTE90_019719 [Oedothorax gibbosus]|uniref:RNA helicase n=1 Tax=Oedothorax gibbosus TaxID=931172 RepID=A0AAV6ULY4_9ARAC|nr:hypothetical protein JTE90_019719 [Oedothorax gibbosus]